MLLPTIHEYIDRRILVNYTADPTVVTKIVPTPFRPKTYKGKAIVGICLIRLKYIKPKGFPDFMGVSSENGAHRIAVEWEEHGETKEGVYIPRRDTSLRLNSLVGGRLFPGKHYLADFNVVENNNDFDIRFSSADQTSIAVKVSVCNQFDHLSIFQTLENASDFFERGAIGYSPNKEKFEGIKLNTYKWEIKPLKAESIHSSFFENESVFPRGTIQFDNALLMTQIEHEWSNIKNVPY